MEQTKPKIENLMEDIRKTSLFRQLVPMEAQSGWPIPQRKDGKVYVTLPFFAARTQGKGQTALFPPFAKITLDWSNKMVVEYVNFRYSSPWPEANWEKQVGTFPHPEIAQMTVGEYQEKRRQLLAMYDKMLEKLTQGKPFSPQWKEGFSQLLRTLMEPSLEPYYRALGSKFFDHFLTKN